MYKCFFCLINIYINDMDKENFKNIMKEKAILFVIHLYKKELEHMYNGNLHNASECAEIRSEFCRIFDLKLEE